MIIAGIFDWLYDAIKGLLSWFLEQIYNLGATLLSGILNGIDSINPTMSDSMSKLLAYVDYFFPLREAVGFASILFTAWVMVMLYRIVKSWIPTVSGT